MAPPWVSTFEDGTFFEWTTLSQPNGTVYNTAAEEGVTPHGGSRMAHFEVTSGEQSSGDIHSKAYKVWAVRDPEVTHGTQEGPSGNWNPYAQMSEGDEKGVYSVWYYFPSGYIASALAWTNMFQWKVARRHSSDPSLGGPTWLQDAQWFINFSRADAWSAPDTVAGYTGGMPVMFAMAWKEGGGWYTPSNTPGGVGVMKGVPRGQWFNIKADLYPGDRIDWYLDNVFWQATPHSYFYVGLGYSDDPQDIDYSGNTGGYNLSGYVSSSWVFGVGHYDGVGELWVDDVSVTDPDYKSITPATSQNIANVLNKEPITWESTFEDTTLFEWSERSIPSGTRYNTAAENGVTPHSGSRMVHLEVTSGEKTAGNIHSKLYKVWGVREPERSGTQEGPPGNWEFYAPMNEGDEKGLYSVWYRFPADYQATHLAWMNFWQWKHAFRPADDPSLGGPNWWQDAQWWLNISPAEGWENFGGGVPPGSTGLDPVMFANCWKTGGGWYTPGNTPGGVGVIKAVPRGVWFNIKADLYPGDRIDWFIDDVFWQSTPHSYYYVGLGYAHDPQDISYTGNELGEDLTGYVDSSWIFGIGHYDGVGKLWADDAMFMDANKTIVPGASVDTAQALDKDKKRGITNTAETDAAQALSASPTRQARQAAPATETDLSNTLVHTKFDPNEIAPGEGYGTEFPYGQGPYGGSEQLGPTELSGSREAYGVHPRIGAGPAQAHAVVRLLSLDGNWEVAGQDRYPAIVPESLTLGYNEWGPETASWTMRRDPGDIHPDLSAYTDCEIEIGGTLVWSGRAKETPSREGADAGVSVTAQGWQYHLDDDVYERKYVHTRLADWQDVRGHIDAPLTRWTAGAQVDAGDGGISFGFVSAGYVEQGVSTVGVYLDLGPTARARRIALTLEKVGLIDAGQYQFVVRGADTIPQVTSPSGTDYEDAIVSDALTLNTSLAGSFATGRRFISIFMIRTGGSGIEAADRIVKLRTVRVFADPTYESAGASILKSSMVVKDALASATMKLDRSTARIPDSSYSLEEYAPEGMRTARENIEAVNAYEDRVAMVTPRKACVFETRPTAATLALGPGSQFEDASANTGEDIYNQAVIEGTGPGGDPIRIKRHIGMVSDPTGPPVAQLVSSPSLPNPSFDVNTTGWTPFGASYFPPGNVGQTTTLTRDTGDFHSAPASGRLNGGYYAAARTTVLGPFMRGTAYRIRVYGKATRTLPSNTLIGGRGGMIEIGVSGDSAKLGGSLNTVAMKGGVTVEAATFSFISATYKAWDVIWVPQNTYADATLTISEDWNVGVTALALWVDSVEVAVIRPTLVDRRSFVRTKILPVQHAVTPASGTQIVDTYLRHSRYTPLKGTVSHPGGRGLIKHMTGEAVPPWEAGLYVNQLVRLGHLVDPDSGGLGRDGRIAGVEYAHGERSASIAIDSTRGNFEALLARLSLATGARVQT